MTRAPVTAAEHTYYAFFQPEPDGGYTVTCPTLPGLVTYGATFDEARAMAADAAAGYVACLEEDGEPVPESDVPGGTPLLEPVLVQRTA
jgi:predicted RNase H-like HicB family nuclease